MACDTGSCRRRRAVTSSLTFLFALPMSKASGEFMINSVTSNTQIAQVQQTQQHQQKVVQAQQKKQAEPQDTVVLRKRATGGGDADHAGDKHSGGYTRRL